MLRSASRSLALVSVRPAKHCKVSRPTPRDSWAPHRIGRARRAASINRRVRPILQLRAGAEPAGSTTTSRSTNHGGHRRLDRGPRRAGEALRASFARLSPQGSDEWNFMGAFTHLGDRYGPYQPGASELADLLMRAESGTPEPARPAAGRRRGRRLGLRRREVGRRRRHGPCRRGVPLSARTGQHARGTRRRTRTSRSTARPGSRRRVSSTVGSSRSPHSSRRGPREATSCTRTVATVRSSRALSDRGVPRLGVEPRGGVALRALERGCDGRRSARSASTCRSVPRAIARRSRARAAWSTACRCTRILPLLAESPAHLGGRRAHRDRVRTPRPAAGNAPTPQPTWSIGRPLHEATWELLLDRSGFVDVAPLPAGPGADERFGCQRPRPPGERRPPLRPRAAPWRRRRAAHAAPA